MTCFNVYARSVVIDLPLRLLAIIWASPYTLLGLLLGGWPLTGGHARIRGRVIQFSMAAA